MCKKKVSKLVYIKILKFCIANKLTSLQERGLTRKKHVLCIRDKRINPECVEQSYKSKRNKGFNRKMGQSSP